MKKSIIVALSLITAGSFVVPAVYAQTAGTTDNSTLSISTGSAAIPAASGSAAPSSSQSTATTSSTPTSKVAEMPIAAAANTNTSDADQEGITDSTNNSADGADINS